MKVLRQIYGISEDQGFICMDGNRTEVDPRHVSRLCEIMKNNAEVDPIIVDIQTKSIIDGQHRYKAAQRLWEEGFPYVLPVDFRDFDKPLMAALTYNNSRKNWTIPDYIHAYITDGRQSYKYLYDFVANHTELSRNGRPQYKVALEIIRTGKLSDIKTGTLTLTNYDMHSAEQLFAEILKIYYAIPNNSRDRFLRYGVVSSWIQVRDEILSNTSLDAYVELLKENFRTPETDSKLDWKQSFMSIIK